jgi:hypothetical protein
MYKAIFIKSQIKLVSHTHSSVTVVFYSDELIQSPDDDPQGSKNVVTIKTT